MTGVIRQRYLPIKEVVQLPPPNVMHLMFVIVRTITKGAVVVLEPYGSLRTGMVHGVGRVVVISAGHVAASVALRYRRFRAQLEANAGRRTARSCDIAKYPAPPCPLGDTVRGALVNRLSVAKARTEPSRTNVQTGAASFGKECRHGLNPGT